VQIELWLRIDISALAFYTLAACWSIITLIACCAIVVSAMRTKKPHAAECTAV
jgi:hypothetical protein